jgi:hypothetical protein
MGIKNVNGQNAYVIEAPAFESRTSRGEGYAQYITNLRWKMWEEAQKSIQVEMEFEKMAYQEQMRFLRSQQTQIQRDIAATNRRLADLDRMEADKQAALSQRNAAAQNTQNAQTRSLQLQAQGTTSTTTGRTASTPSSATRTRSDVLGDLSGDTQDSFQRVQEAANIAGGSETDPSARITTQANKAMERGNYQLGAGGGVTAGDEQAFKASIVAAEVERAGDAAEAAGGSRDAAETEAYNAFSADYRSDYDNVLQTAAPTAGAGGGRVAVPPTTTTRSGKAVPKAEDLVEGSAADYTKARAALIAERERLEAQLTGLQTPAPPQFDMLERTRDKFQVSYGEGGFGLAPRPTRAIPRFDEPAALRLAKDLAEQGAAEEVARFQAANPDVTITPTQMASLRRQGALSMLNQMGGREVSAQDFLDFRETEPAVTDEGVAPTRAMPDLPADEPPAEEPAPAGPQPDGLFPSQEVMEQARKPRELPIPSRLPLEQLPIDPELEQQVREQGQRGPVLPTTRKSLTDFEYLEQMRAIGAEQEALRNLQTESFRRQLADEDLRRQALIRSVPVDETTPVQRPLFAPIDRTGQSITSQVPPSEERGEIRNLQGEVIRELPSPAEQAEQRQEQIANTTMERRQKYKLNVIKGAERLASRPKKFERIAKPNLAPEERRSQVAPYVIVVDNLYDTNTREMSAPDAIRASYMELNRVYADEPKVREQAQEYLLAKDLLQAQIDNPE